MNYVKRILAKHFDASAKKCSDTTKIPRRTLDYWVGLGFVPAFREAAFIAAMAKAGIAIQPKDCGAKDRIKDPTRWKAKAVAAKPKAPKARAKRG